MSILSSYIQKEAQLKKLQEELSSLKDNPDFQQDLRFKESLETLMKEYDVSKSHVLKIVAPDIYNEESKPKKARKPRKLKVYTNPQTGEVVETRGGNHKVLRAWKIEYGKSEVESWAVIPEDEEQKKEEATPEPKPEPEQSKQEEPPVEDNKEPEQEGVTEIDDPHIPIPDAKPANDDEAVDSNKGVKNKPSGKKGKQGKGKDGNPKVKIKKQIKLSH